MALVRLWRDLLLSIWRRWLHHASPFSVMWLRALPPSHPRSYSGSPVSFDTLQRPSVPFLPTPGSTQQKETNSRKGAHTDPTTHQPLFPPFLKAQVFLMIRFGWIISRYTHKVWRGGKVMPTKHEYHISANRSGLNIQSPVGLGPQDPTKHVLLILSSFKTHWFILI